MKRNIYINLLILLSGVFLLISCIEVVDNPNIPYEEQFVVSAVLLAGEQVLNIRISKTLPPLEEYNLDKALITDATAVIKSKDAEYPLIFNGVNNYYAEGLIPESGETYTLDIKWNSLHATAITTVPFPIEIDTFSITIKKNDDWYWDAWTIFVNAEFQPLSNSVYRGYYQGYYYDNVILRSQDTLRNGLISLPVYGWGTNDTTNIIKQLKQNIQNQRITIEAYDSPFYKYFITRYEGDFDSIIFGTSGSNVLGNINNGIGIFVGKVSTETTINIE